ncbi:transmembrane protein, putative (macronuclear) [Tetrahymena thermophila SB210]|uniref:Transmembrane protein, putative n=1 Tax=Tetrahymena thermophila (strain SB210) TaxID=312017 RepID=W7XL04_TETTS|nr:transmembrane protein, putative [Tetrahymena thermophila SB210]EWS75444.1 transmembrane protein, putative [Tetrahymena thermophila SB210]|eukprot:XP_012652029.1 transmembrane protein, putative [Tetrahymena thermophila SB210]
MYVLQLAIFFQVNLINVNSAQKIAANAFQTITVFYVCQDSFQQYYSIFNLKLINLRKQNSQGQCVGNCGDNQLKNTLNKQCQNVPDINCQKYNQQNQCQQCKDGYILSKNKICENTFCSGYQGTYDISTQKCSLDGFLLSDYSREQQDQQANAQLTQDSFSFQYSSLKESLNEQIIEIIVLDILDYKLVLFQYICLNFVIYLLILFRQQEELFNTSYFMSTNQCLPYIYLI